jgi:tetratricopeptide (TPR) repeat protein
MTLRITAMLALAGCLHGCAPTPASSADETSLRPLEVARNEGWLVREIREFRTYPHLDRAFRLIASGALAEARRELEQYLAIDPEDLKVRFHYLVLLHRLGEHHHVVREADTVLHHRPAFTPARLYRGLAHHATAVHAAALDDFQRVAEAPDAEPQSRALALGMVTDLALAQGQGQVALAAAERLQALQPGAVTALRRGRSLEALGRLDEADAAFEIALAQADTAEARAEAYGARAALAERRRDWRQASAALRAMLETDPRNPVLLRRLGEVAYARGDLRESARWFGESATAAESAEDAERAANALYAAADFQEGTRRLSGLIAHVSAAEDRHRILVALGHGYVKLGKLEDAARAFRDAVQIKPDVPTVTALADILQRAGRPLDAATALETVAGRDASGRTHLAIATLYAKLRRWEPALAHLAASTAGDATAQTKGEAYKQQGFIHSALERYGEARVAFERSIQYTPKDASVYMALGEVCMRLNAPQDAVAYLKRALALSEGRDPS